MRSPVAEIASSDCSIDYECRKSEGLTPLLRKFNGTACASSRDLSDTKLVLTRSGSGIRTEAVTPDNEMFGSAKLDFDAVVPDTIPLVVEDGSGDLTIDNVGASEVTDGSGDMTIRNVNGNLSVHDGSGDMRLENVSGDIRMQG